METRSKKNVGILLAAIMVTSVFAMMAPTPLIASDSGDIQPMASLPTTVTASDQNATATGVLYWMNFTTISAIPQYGHIIVTFPGGTAPYNLDSVNASTNVSLCVDGTTWTYGGVANFNYTDIVNTAILTVDINVTNTTGIPAGSNVSIDIENVTNSGAGWKRITVQTLDTSSTLIDSGYYDLCIYAQITYPTEGSYVHGNWLNATWIDNPANCDWTWKLKRNVSGIWYPISDGMQSGTLANGAYALIDISGCIDGFYRLEVCPPAGCLCLATVNFIIDRTPPTLMWEYVQPGALNNPNNNTWYNCLQEINWNTTATDAPSGIKDVTINLTDKASATNWPAGVPSKVIELKKNGTTDYYDYNSNVLYPGGIFQIAWLKEFNMQAIEVRAYDNATNLQTNASFQMGVDCTPPGKVEDVNCNNVSGAIIVTWTDKEYDVLGWSGVDHYNVYYNDTTAGKTGKITTSGRTGTHTFDGNWLFNTVGGNYGDVFTFNVTAVDKAGNEGIVHSVETDPQTFMPGTPDKLILDVPEELTACGEQIHDIIKATVKDTYGVKIANVTVCVRGDPIHLFPKQNKTQYGCPNNGIAFFGLHEPKVPLNASVYAWVCDPNYPEVLVNDTAYIVFKPHKAKHARVEADPREIGECENSTITVTLLNKHYNVAVGDIAKVVLTTTAGEFVDVKIGKDCTISVDKKTVTGWTVNGTLVVNLHCDKAPGKADIVADIGGGYWIETTDVKFLGPVTEFCMDLRQGRNDISIPLWPQDDAGDYNTTCENVLASLGTNVNSVYYYDAEEEEWLVWLPGGFGELEHMVPGKGYQVYLAVSDKWCINGTFLRDDDYYGLPDTYTVVPGWNMIGFHSLNKEITPSRYIAGRSEPGIESGIKYQEPLWSYHAGYRSTGQSAAYNKHYMKPGWGYWVYITDDGGVIIPHWEE